MLDNILKNVWPEWQIIKEIGRGTCGIVYEAEKIDSQGTERAAIKVITVSAQYSNSFSPESQENHTDTIRKKNKKIVDAFADKLKVLKSLTDAGNIVRIDDYKVVESENNLDWNIFVRMELLTPLSEFLRSHTLDENGIIYLGIDICSALEKCSEINLVHGNIKPENIYIDRLGDFKLGDFGVFSDPADVGNGLTAVETLSYIAPELAAGEASSPKTDLYALGLVMYVLANDNRLPFISADEMADPKSKMNSVMQRANGEVLPPPCNASQSFAQVLSMACDRNPENRFKNAAALKKALKFLRKTPEEFNKFSPKIYKKNPIPDVGNANGYIQETHTGGSSEGSSTPVKRRNPAKIIVPLAVLGTLAFVFLDIIMPRLIYRNGSKSCYGSILNDVVSDTEPYTFAAEESEETNFFEENEPAQLSVGEIVYFGSYEQDNNILNGTEPIAWLVLDEQYGGYLMVSLFGLDCQMYDSTGSTDVTWETCTLRQWLNYEFYYEAFTDEERGIITDALIYADYNREYPDRNPGYDTYDNVFLLSTADVERYLSSSGYAAVMPTEYAVAQGVKDNENNNDQGYGFWWWLRTPGRDADYAALVFPSGEIDYIGYHYNDTENAVRPAIWIAPNQEN